MERYMYYDDSACVYAEGNTLSQRRGYPGQYTDPGSGQVNQTYSRYPTSSDAVLQGKINRAVPEKYYKKEE